MRTHYLNSGRGRRSHPLSAMLRVHYVLLFCTFLAREIEDLLCRAEHVWMSEGTVHEEAKRKG